MNRPRPSRSGWRWPLASFLGALVVSGLLSVQTSALAASLSPKDMDVIARALTFLQPPLSAAFVAIVYTSTDPASRRDAEEIAGMLSGGLKVGPTVLMPRVLASQAIGAGGFALMIAATGASGPEIKEFSRTARIMCVTADMAAVQAGLCTMAVKSLPRVEIVVNHAAASASGTAFAAAFRMMIKEI